MKDLNYVASEISKGKNLGINLDKYAKGMNSMYHALAYIKLAMNYYTVFDMYREEPLEEPLFEECYAEFNKLAVRLVSGGKLTVGEVDTLRTKITGIMETVTAFVDRLRIYEHVLNRVEYRFKENNFDREYYNTYLTNDLMHYILSDRDNVVIHSKIAEIVGQLPMRLSKNKFFEYLREAFSLYHGAQRGTIDDFAYSLRTTAMIEIPESFDKIMPDMHALINMLEEADYAALDGEKYAGLHDALAAGADKMNRCADYFVLLQQMVNDLYTIVVTADFTVGDVEETELASSIVRHVCSAHSENHNLDNSILDKFELFEGKQERILSAVSQCDYAVELAMRDYSDEISQEQLTPEYEALKSAEMLQSGSDFVELRRDEALTDIPDDEYADKVCEGLIVNLQELFGKVSQPVKRAIMATLLSQLPVFFNNTEEIQNYINVSLIQCTDEAEQAAVVEILKVIISN